MIGTRLVWKMAWENMRRQWKQTLLTTAAGAIGALLIAVSFVNYQSVKHSGDAWIDARFGPIDWELRPKNEQTSEFTAEEAESIIAEYKQGGAAIRFLPVIQGDSTLIAGSQAGSEQQRSKTGMLVIGLSGQRAKSFDSTQPEVWGRDLRFDEAVIDEDTALDMDIRQGDAIQLMDHEGKRQLFQVRLAAKQTGLTGFRGGNAAAAGTVIVSEEAARKLVGMKQPGYHTLLAGRTDPGLPVAGFTYYGKSDSAIFQLRLLKYEAENKADNLNISFIVSMISGVAVASSALLMRQVLIMIAEGRRGMYGVLRAIGISRRQIGGIFAAEALLLSIFSAAAGTLLGTAGGYALVKLFYGVYSEELSRISGANIPVTPYVSIAGTVQLFAVIAIFLGMIAVVVAWKAGRIRIVDALRDGTAGAASYPGRKSKRRFVLLIGCAIVVAAHLYQSLIAPPELSGSRIGAVLFLWLCGCIGAVILILHAVSGGAGMIGAIARRLGFPDVSVLLAVKYPNAHRSRTLTISLLFAFVMMTITFMSSISTMVLTVNDVDRNNQTMLGFGGYAGYTTPEQKASILSVIERDKQIADSITSVTTVEPYMLLMEERGSAQAVIPVTEALVRGGGLKLIERDARFESDEDVWKAVMNDPAYIVLPITDRDVSLVGTGTDAQTRIKTGDRITLPVYENKLRSSKDEWKPLTEQSFVVAGFADENSDNKARIQVYDATYVNEEVHRQLRKYGHKWPNQDELGFVLVQFDYRHVETAQRLKDRFVVNGIMTFQAPYSDNAAEQLVNRQLFRGFIGFTALSALIGLLGLAVVQFRAVRERSRAIAMMSCMGLSGAQITRMFVLEGSIVAASGLLTGWAVGTTGSNLFIHTLSQDVKPYEEAIPFHYPYDMIVPMLLGLLLAALLINIGPARSALKLTPADALRSSEE
ncbi:ABC transporter permease [Paenibacillus mendelii]|uniref:FtsX-like permease family protein n=1 Tax=Paenibacillus mendelii TaxID=206163 RepID=A0ABV6JHE2_9BACL|nr:FtsX-like permease family protein [Paenibacillus mendelii]MCQ6558202.1 FtsX-like permease family protein [Paenibacillus mendelii]